MKFLRPFLPTALLVLLAGCQSAPPPTAVDRENSQKPSPSTTPNGTQAPH